MIANVRQWWYYPIEMPLNNEGQGPATVGVDAVAITYEVWDVLLNTHAVFDNLPDAINEAMRLNAALDLSPDPRVTALVDAATPFYAAVFNDNGDVTISTGHLTTADWLRLDAALAAMKGGGE